MPQKSLLALNVNLPGVKPPCGNATLRGKHVALRNHLHLYPVRKFHSLLMGLATLYLFFGRLGFVQNGLFVGCEPRTRASMVRDKQGNVLRFAQDVMQIRPYELEVHAKTGFACARSHCRSLKEGGGLFVYFLTPLEIARASFLGLVLYLRVFNPFNT